ncbi:hypothetical protein L7F22_066390 [Adiantum nelumboides]|nr:hypothetical protein [Adiantum nelumboides]
MRVVNCFDNAAKRNFVQWILDIGNGNVCDGRLDDNVALPACMILSQGGLQALIECMYRDLGTLFSHASFFKGKAILAARNKDVDTINSMDLQQMNGMCKEYVSANSVCKDVDTINNMDLQQMNGMCKEYVSADSICKSNCDSILFTVEFLNTLDLGRGFPPHTLQLKENAHVMLLQNLDPRHGLCNGTRLICKEFHSKVIDTKIIIGLHTTSRVLIPRVDFFMGAREGLPFEMKRR